MAGEAIPIINGHRYDWSSVVIDMGAAGEVSSGCTAISYEVTRERSKAYGAGRAKPQGRTRGRLDYTASITLHKETLDEVLAKLGTSFGDVSLTITVSFAAAENRIVTDILEGVEIDGLTNDHSDGTDALTVAVPLNVMNIKFSKDKELLTDG